jgi:hypothetical protein
LAFLILHRGPESLWVAVTTLLSAPKTMNVGVRTATADVALAGRDSVRMIAAANNAIRIY